MTSGTPHPDSLDQALRSALATAEVARDAVVALDAYSARSSLGASAHREVAKLRALALDPVRRSDVDSPPAAQRHLERLDALLSQSLANAQQACRVIADDLARGEEWDVGPYSPGPKAVAALDVGWRLGELSRRSV
jgi:hypothetical protein